MIGGQDESIFHNTSHPCGDSTPCHQDYDLDDVLGNILKQLFPGVLSQLSHSYGLRNYRGHAFQRPVNVTISALSPMAS